MMQMGGGIGSRPGATRRCAGSLSIITGTASGGLDTYLLAGFAGTGRKQAQATGITWKNPASMKAPAGMKSQAGPARWNGGI